MGDKLSLNQLSRHRTGFLAIPGFASTQEVVALRERAAKLVDGFDPFSSSSVFSTRNQVRGSTIYVGLGNLLIRLCVLMVPWKQGMI